VGSWDSADPDTWINSPASTVRIKGGRRLLTTASRAELSFASRTRNGQGSDGKWSKSHFRRTSAHLGADKHARSKHGKVAASDPEVTRSFPGARGSEHRWLVVSALTTVARRFRKMRRSKCDARRDPEGMGAIGCGGIPFPASGRLFFRGMCSAKS